MRRVLSLPIALLVATTLTGAAAAQTRPAVRQDLRQISWPGRNAAAPEPAPEPEAARTDLRRTNLVIPHGGFGAVEPAAAPRPAPAPRRTLTPADSWLRPAAPAPAPAAIATVPVRSEAASPPPASRPAAIPEYLPDHGRRGQHAPADIVYAAPPEPAPSDTSAASDQPADPMAPRRDAPIFRIQQAPPSPEPAPEAAVAQEPAPAPRPRYVAEVVNTGERPPQQGARYYSVHRQNGRQPDSLAMPEPTYVDALAITMTQTPASQDLAEPEQGPNLIRDNQGRTRPVPAASDGDHQ
ncbi:hypothetical protein [Brevundimonas sp.]|uniref:hypothetical protein n=1 Tax=Brevundimonas sp. TaxID=1871086 RepID=UPI002FC9647D